MTLVAVVMIGTAAAKDADKDGSLDEKGAGADCGDDGHDHGGDHQALVATTCSSNGEPS